MHVDGLLQEDEMHVDRLLTQEPHELTQEPHEKRHKQHDNITCEDAGR